MRSISSCDAEDAGSVLPLYVMVMKQNRREYLSNDIDML